MRLDFSTAFPDCFPQSLASLNAGEVKNGLFYPSGSVAKHYAELQFNRDKEKATQDVYFIRSVNGGPVKIGVAQDVGSRLATLQTAHPYRLVVIGIIKAGGVAKEKELHQQFAKYRLLGEWFEWNMEIERLLA